jgi:phosphate starvation-inducible PhoH-like protein
MKRSRSSKYQEKTEKNESKKVNFRLKALNSKQAEYIKLLNTKDVVMAIGVAGTGKSMVAAIHAAEKLANHEIEKIIVTRPYLGTTGTIGFLGGSLNEKMAPVCAPILTVLENCLGKSQYQYALDNKQIEMVPTEFLRGASYNDCVVIADEAQNNNQDTMKAICTRIGYNCQLVLTGDVVFQCDLGSKNDSGLAWLIRMQEKYGLDEIGVVQFEVEDIVRSGFCKSFVRMMYQEGEYK